MTAHRCWVCVWQTPERGRDQTSFRSATVPRGSRLSGLCQTRCHSPYDKANVCAARAALLYDVDEIDQVLERQRSDFHFDK